MSTSDSPPEAKQVFSAFHVTVTPPHGERTEAKVLDIGFRSINLAVPEAEPFEKRKKGMVQVRLTSAHLTMPVEALCRVQSVIPGDVETIISLDVLDWIGLREQLPANMRQFLSLRSVERWIPAEDQRPDVQFTCMESAVASGVKMYDLSTSGMSMLIPREWGERLDRGDRVELRFNLPDGSDEMQIIGFVRHVSFENEDLHCGVLFDVNLTTEFMVKQIRLMRFVDMQNAVN